MYFSPKPPASMLGTFGFVLFATMVKEAIEDYGRYKSDVKANNREARKYDYEEGEWATVAWKDIRIGDLV